MMPIKRYEYKSVSVNKIINEGCWWHWLVVVGSDCLCFPFGLLFSKSPFKTCASRNFSITSFWKTLAGSLGVEMVQMDYREILGCLIYILRYRLFIIFIRTSHDFFFGWTTSHDFSFSFFFIGKYCSIALN